MLATLLAGVGAVLPVGAASAHSELIAMSPKNGATVSTAPTRIVFTFSEDVNADFSRVKVLDEKGADVSGGGTEVSGNIVSQPLQADLGPGTYHVAYKIVSADGHPVSGTAQFTVTGSSAGPSTSAAGSSPSSAGASATTNAASPTSGNAAAAAPAATADAASASSVSPVWLWVLLGALLLAGLGAGPWVLRRRATPEH